MKELPGPAGQKRLTLEQYTAEFTREAKRLGVESVTSELGTYPGSAELKCVKGDNVHTHSVNPEFLSDHWAKNSAQFTVRELDRTNPWHKAGLT